MEPSPLTLHNILNNLVDLVHLVGSLNQFPVYIACHLDYYQYLAVAN